MEGKVLLNKEVSNHQGTISLNIADQPAGIYLLRWVDGEITKNTRVILYR
ncbi:MAG: hypothetical protein EA362_08760 [Saprospirales bacterium]|nr:MAG: hypothetical protein EA362_08760 [Saprospirales bacterium]